MGDLPKIRIKKHWGGWPPDEQIFDLDGARDFLCDYWPSATNLVPVFVVVDGQLIQSYEELVKIVNQDKYRNKVYLEVGLYPVAGGG